MKVIRYILCTLLLKHHREYCSVFLNIVLANYYNSIIIIYYNCFIVIVVMQLLT